MRFELDDLVVIDDDWSPFHGLRAQVIDLDTDLTDGHPDQVEVCFEDGRCEWFSHVSLELLTRTP